MQSTLARLQITPMKNDVPGHQPQMLGKELVAFRNETHGNASKPWHAATGSSAFGRCFHAGIDWEKIMAGAPLLAPLGE